jgi:hypothetical protein
MKHLLATLAAALAFTAGAWAQERWAGRVVACGTLLQYKSAPELLRELPSAPAQYVVIRFDKPFEIEHSNWEYEDGGKAGKVRVTEIQLYYAGEDADLQPLIGKKVIAEGEITERAWTREMRPLIFYVKPGNIKAGAFMQVKEKEAQTEEPSNPPAPEATPEATPEIAQDIDYSQEPGLPVEWEEYTIQK